MAELEQTIVVEVESVVHGVMRDLAQKIWDKHSILVNSVRFSWRDVSSIADARMIVVDVDVESKTLPKSRAEATL